MVAWAEKPRDPVPIGRILADLLFPELGNLPRRIVQVVRWGGYPSGTEWEWSECVRAFVGGSFRDQYVLRFAVMRGWGRVFAPAGPRQMELMT
jgi:hypothetical protein